MPAPPQENVRNFVLRALTPADFILLQPSMEKVELEFRKALAVAGTPIDEVYFPESGLASIIARTSDGRAAVGLYARDGFSGGSLILGVLQTPHEQVVQMAGSALRIASTDLTSAAAESLFLTSVLSTPCISICTRTIWRRDVRESSGAPDP